MRHLTTTIATAFLATVIVGCASEAERAQKTCEDSMMAFVMSQNFVRRDLRSPSTAKFPSYNSVSVRYMGDCTHSINAYVDAQNAFGGTVRNQYVALMQNERGTTSWRALELVIIP